MPAARTFYLLAAATLLLVGSVVVPALGPGALLFDSAILAAFAIDLYRASRPSLSASRTWPPVLFQGQSATLEVTLRNDSSRSVRMQVRETLHPAVAPRPARLEVEVGAGGAHRWKVALAPCRRGDHDIGPLTVRLLGPWRLAWSQRRLLATQTRPVYPRVRWSGAVGTLLSLAHRRQIGRLPKRQHGTSGEVYALREYLPGDPLNRLHWKATARHSRPISREQSWERGMRLLILLDTGRSMASEYGGRSKLDHALAATLALARVAVSRADRVTIAAFSNQLEQEVALGTTAKAIGAAYASLYDLEARLANPAYELAADYALRVGGRRVIVVLMTSITDIVAAEILRDCLVKIRRRHRPILINLTDPHIAELLDEPASSPAGAFARLSALDISLANQRLAHRLRRSGIRVVSSRADTLGIDTLSTYLETLGLSLATLGRIRRGPGFEATAAAGAPGDDADRVSLTAQPA